MSRAKDGLLAYLQDAYQEKIESTKEHLSSGGCVDFAEYKYQCGIMYGVALAEGILLDLDEMQHRQEFGEDEHTV